MESGYVIQSVFETETCFWDGSQWDSDELKAVRFVRREDAEAAARGLFRLGKGMLFEVEDRCFD